MRKFAILLLLSVAVCLAVLVAFNQWANKNISLPENLVYTLQPGIGFSQVSSELIELGVSFDPTSSTCLRSWKGLSAICRRVPTICQPHLLRNN